MFACAQTAFVSSPVTDQFTAAGQEDHSVEIEVEGNGQLVTDVAGRTELKR